MKIELPDYERSHKPRSNTFDEFCKEFEVKTKLSVHKNPPVFKHTEEKIPPRKISKNVRSSYVLRCRKLIQNKKKQKIKFKLKIKPGEQNLVSIILLGAKKRK